MKSWSRLILNALISGVAISTFGLPPYRSSFASTSPKDRLTDNLPGYIRTGPLPPYEVGDSTYKPVEFFVESGIFREYT